MYADVKQLLKVKDEDSEDIFAIIGRMELLLDYFNSEEDLQGLSPFLHVYQLVTKKVQEECFSEQKRIHNYKQLKILDVYFAKLYFQPLRKYLSGEKVPKPWQQYFHYAGSDSYMPMTSLLLGINAHITSDLTQSIFDLDYKSKQDFNYINDILESLIPEVMRYLASKKDIFALAGLFADEFVKQEFKAIVVRWRRQSWQNHLLLRSGDLKLQELHEKTEKRAEDIIETVSLSSLKHPQKMLREMPLL
jgi:hypothetical protein